MRQRCAAVLMMFCLLLSSCGAAENGLQDAIAFRSALAARGCAFDCAISCAVGERNYVCKLACAFAPDGEVQIEVLQPESISGIKATMTSLTSVIEFDGIMLDFGSPHELLTSPLYAPLVCTLGWCDGYIDCAGLDGDTMRVTYRIGYDEDELILESWSSGGVPIAFEIYAEEDMILSASVENFTFLS